MTRLGVSFTDIATAAEELKARGQEPTIEKVRHHLGTGSNSTIGKYLHEWRLHGSAVQAALTKSHTPDPLKLAVDKVWQQVSEQAQQEIEKVREELLAKLILTDETCQTLAKERDQLQTAITESSQRECDLFAEKEMLAIEFRGLKDENLQWQERCRGLEQLNKQQKLHQEVELKNLVETHGSEMARLEGLLQEFYSRQDQLLHEIKQQYQAEKQELIEEQQHLRADLTLERQRHGELIAKLQVLSDELQLRETTLANQLQAMKVEIITQATQTSEQYDKTLTLSVDVLQNTTSLSREIKSDMTNWNASVIAFQDGIREKLETLTLTTQNLSKMMEVLQLNQPAKAS